jgi:hypothetical protein
MYIYRANIFPCCHSRSYIFMPDSTLACRSWPAFASLITYYCLAHLYTHAWSSLKKKMLIFVLIFTFCAFDECLILISTTLYPCLEAPYIYIYVLIFTFCVLDECLIHCLAHL